MFSDFSKQKAAKERWHSLVSGMGDRETPLPLPPSLYGCLYADVITKFSRLDGLPFLLAHGASCAEARLKITAVCASSCTYALNGEST